MVKRRQRSSCKAFVKIYNIKGQQMIKDVKMGSITLDEIANDWSEEEGFERTLLAYRIKEVLENCRGNKLLDIGCGVGLLCDAVSSRMKLVVGIDGSSKKIDRGRQFIKSPNVMLVNSLIEDYNPNDHFDTIVMTNILEHIDNPVGTLKCIKDWLASDGICIITVPNALALHKRIGRHMGLIDDFYTLTPSDKAKGHRRIYDADKLRSDLEAAGFTVEKLTGLFLKPLSSKQMESFELNFIDALYKIGKELPAYCSSIMVFAKPSGNK
jgi:2-polyprenyl-3-methyl-5-hydroxy-6-metoxy-1,4-benzoquinol methylase